MAWLLMLFCWVNFSSGCGHKPDDPGLCPLNCSKALIGPIEGQIEVVHATQDLICPAASALAPVTDPLMFQFRISESFATDFGDKQVPLPSVSVEPIVNGLRSDQPEHNPNVEINGDVFTPARYKGVVTPSENWCSDACGIVSMEIVPLCPPVGESSGLTIQVHSGALYSDPYEVTISTAEPN
jgi:hypothetical protein